MKKWLKVLLIGVGVVFVAFAALIIVLLINDFKQEDILKKEIINYSNKNLAEDDFTVKVKTTGDYAYVEEAIKKYYKQLSDNVKAINAYLHDKEFLNVLAPNNLSLDRPNYSKSHLMITSTKENVNKCLKAIDRLCEKKTIGSLLDKDKLDDYEYYYDFYMQLMYTDQDKEDFKEIKEEMDSLTKLLNSFLDKADEILYFLEKNDSVIEYSNGLVYFNSQSALDGYNRLYNELQALSRKFLEFSSTDSDKDKNKKDVAEA